MKKAVSFAGLMLMSSISLASSDVIFPIKNQEVKAYPGAATLVLNAKGGIHNDVPYELSCQINNPNEETVAVVVTFDQNLDLTYYPWISLNGSDSSSVLHLEPGMNTFVYGALMTNSYNPIATMKLSNLDYTNSVIVENCKAALL